MTKFTPLILAALALGMLAVYETPAAAAVASEFNQALHGEYMARAARERAENHHVAADLFTSKAQAAAANEYVSPENPRDYEIPPEYFGELYDARVRLMRALDRGGRAALPAVAASAQKNYDCWVEEQEENIQPLHIAACKEAFLAALARVEPLVAEPEPGPAPIRPHMVIAAPMPAPMPAPAVARSYLVFFDWDKSDLTAEARNIIRTAAANAAAARAGRVTVTGHTDTSGTDRYNMGLSVRRAEAVKTELVRQGIGGATTDVLARGELDPLVATPDGVREPQNRRAEIVF
ncbi:MAG: OmpA family protein [Alphaproteobacteria bacterium]